MKEINIRIWHHEKEKDWSVDVDGVLYHHVSTKTVDELVEYAVVAAQQAEVEPKSPAAHGETNTDLPN